MTGSSRVAREVWPSVSFCESTGSIRRTVRVVPAGISILPDDGAAGGDGGAGLSGAVALLSVSRGGAGGAAGAGGGEVDGGAAALAAGMLSLDPNSMRLMSAIENVWIRSPTAIRTWRASPPKNDPKMVRPSLKVMESAYTMESAPSARVATVRIDMTDLHSTINQFYYVGPAGSLETFRRNLEASGSENVFKELQGFFGARFPAETGRCALAAGLGCARSHGRRQRQRGERGADLAFALRVHEETAFADDLRKTRRIRGDDRNACRHRLRRRKAEALIQRHVRHSGRARGQGRQLGFSDVAKIQDAFDARTKTRDCALRPPARRSCDQQIEFIANSRAQALPGVEQRVDVLARLDGPHEQEIRAVSFRWQGVEVALVDAGVNGLNTLGGDAENADRVLSGVFRDGDQSRGALQHPIGEFAIGADIGFGV